MASKIMQQITETEAACDARLAEAKAAAAQTVADTGKRAERMRAQAEGYGRQKAEEILGEAEKEAERIRTSARENGGAELEALGAVAEQRREAAVEATVARLLELA